MTADDLRRAACLAVHPAATTQCVVSSDILTSIVEGLATAVVVTSSPISGVRRTLVLQTVGYDVWTLEWSPGSSTDGHDHEGSASAAHVVSGRLEEVRSTLDGTGRSTRTEVRTGQTTTLAAVDAHQLTNIHSGVTVSIHAYSPPLGP